MEGQVDDRMEAAVEEVVVVDPEQEGSVEGVDMANVVEQVVRSNTSSHHIQQTMRVLTTPTPKWRNSTLQQHL